MTVSSSTPDEQSPQETARQRLSALIPQLQEWISKGLHTEVLSRYDEIVAIAEQCEDDILLANTLNTFGNYFWRVGRFDDAYSNMQRSLVTMRKYNNPLHIGILLNNIGNIFRVRGYFAEALEHFETARDEFRKVNDKRGIAFALGNIATLFIETDRHAESVPFFIEAIDLLRELGDIRGEANFLSDYAKTLIELGETERAIQEAEYAVSLVEGSSDEHTLGTVLNSLGLVYSRSNRYDEAKTVFNRALALHRSSHNQRFIGVTLSNLGYLARVTGDKDLAIQHYRGAAAVQKQIEDVRSGAITQWNMSVIYFSRKQWNECLPLLTQVIDVFRNTQKTASLFDALLLLAEVHRQRGEFSDSLASIELAEDVSLQHLPDLHGIILSYRALLCLDRGERETALDWLTKAEKQVSQQTPEADTLYWMARVFYLIAPVNHNKSLDEETIAAVKAAYRKVTIANALQANHIDYLLELLQHDIQTKLSSLGIHLSE